MTFVSYAQNFEDVMLWRALRSIEEGFYIDIGAQDPIVDSVSYAFYLNGWRGVHVEPTTYYASKLKAARPDEIVEQCAIGVENGAISFFEFPNTGLSTGCLAIAERHKASGFDRKDQRIPVITLDNLLERYGAQEIHWLKIDVEGMELDVIKGWSSSNVRPWILVIESTAPLTQEDAFRSWEDNIIEKGYFFVYFDGLNRFYLHASKHRLKVHFNAPPNFFDGFALSVTSYFARLPEPFVHDQSASELEVETDISPCSHKSELAFLRTEKNRLEQKLSDIKHNHQNKIEALTEELKVKEKEAASLRQLIDLRLSEIDRLSQNYNNILESKSWKITFPLRLLAGSIKDLSPFLVARQNTFRQPAKLLTSSIIWNPIFQYMDANPILRNSFLKGFPHGTKRRAVLASIVHKMRARTSSIKVEEFSYKSKKRATDAESLSKHAARIHVTLCQTARRKNG